MIPKNLKISRENLDIKQKDLAKFFKLSKSTISGWETGLDIIPIKRLIKYANEYNLSLDYLFGIIENNLTYMPIEIDLKKIAKNLKQIRNNHNLTQVELAKKIKTSQSTYSQYEIGKYIIPTCFLCELIKVYKDLSIDELFNRKRH